MRLYTVKIASIDEFRASRDKWNELVMSMKAPSVFCAWEWVFTWWERFGKLYEPVILFVYKDATLVGILPLASRYTAFRDGLITGRILSYCGSMELYPDHLDIISGEECAGRALEAIVTFLTANYTDWDVLHLSNLTEDGWLVPWLKKRDLRFDIQKATVSPFISLTGGFDEYMKRFGKKNRHNMTRLRNRLRQTYGVEYKICDNSKAFEIESVLKDLFELHQLRKQETQTKSTFRGQEIIEFHRSLAARFADKGWLSLSSFRKEDKAIAVSYGFTFAERFNYYQNGFDPAWNRHSVGSSLILELIENSYNEKLKEFDFLRGNEGYKSVWTEKSRTLWNANIYNKTFRGRVIKTAYGLRRLIKKLK